ncbi:BTB/POZ domain-containing protein KCTD7-like isoform X1 [Haliotis rubra]|uniref:BTB/POZ domain-containing protein KCTD7-like isoform X1 n=1 Tax=Haliotis rubra TaxID=36100 RepID=UPI001EE5A344|nr:BTB/POZ domain-containing protein KCTD7-like isoform X1 [Haliotis rubra]
MGEEADGNTDTSPTVTFPSVVTLNVGGKHFATRLSTLRRYPESMLAVMFSGRHNLDTDPDGNYFIDRDGTHFHHILNFLRHDDPPPADLAEEILKDAVYYGIDPLIDHLKSSPALFTEYVVRENLRSKLVKYHDIKDDIINLAKDQVRQTGAIKSTVRLVVTKNQPIPRDLQFSKQVYKQFYRRFRTYDTFEECLEKYFIQVPADKVKGQPDLVMNEVANCILFDLKRDGYSGNCRPESIHEEHKIKTVTWCDDQFHVFASIHIFNFNWLESDKVPSPNHHRLHSANF